MNLRVCMMIYHYWPGPEGGTERQCRRLTAALSRRGVACTVLTTRPGRDVPARESDGGVRIVRLPSLEGFRRRPAAVEGSATTLATASRPPARAARLAAAGVAWFNALLYQAGSAFFLLRHARDFDLIHVHTSEWIAGFAVWLGRRLRRPVLCKVATLPALPAATKRVPFGRAWDRRRRQAEFVSLNEAMAAELRAAGVPEQRVRVIPNSVELPDLSCRREDADLVLFVGNLTQHEWKAFDVLFDAWALVHAERPSARLAVFGGGDPAPWERYLEARGCRASVSFEGFVRDVNAGYARAAVLALPSRQEGMSNALLEAQSWGVPAVVSDIPANRAVVSDGENGLVVPVNDAGSLTVSLLRLLRDAGLRAVLGAAARRAVERRFGVELVAELTLATYATMLHAEAEPARVG